MNKAQEVLLDPLLNDEDLLASIRSYLERTREQILKLHDEGREDFRVLSFRTGAIDRLLVFLLGWAKKEVLEANVNLKTTPMTLLSQGGYGRRELCLHSDIDLLFLYKGSEFVKVVTEKILKILWDAGLEVGCATRTIRECRKLMQQDLTILTSLLDARFLAGDKTLSDEFQQMIQKYFSTDVRTNFSRLKIKENEERHDKYGGSVYLLEPNLKESKGGLRDYHTLYWFARMRDRIGTPQDLVTRQYLKPEEFETLWKALQFIWSLRNELHRRAGRRVDQLTFEHQEPLAQYFGFSNTEQFLGVELFMQRYYTEASHIHELCEKAIRRLNRPKPSLFPPAKVPLKDPHLRLVHDKLTVASLDLFEKEPLYFLKIFEVARKLNVELDDLAQERIHASLSRIDHDFQNHPGAGALFREMFKNPAGLGKMLSLMNNLGVLGAFLPEFKKLRFRAQHDVYHVYTVDVHSIFAVTELGKLAQGDYASPHPSLSAMMNDIDKKEVLAFAIFYHDIGKGEGKGHVEKGAPLIRRAGERLGFSPGDVDILEFLERSHLIMTHLAFRRDLEDQNMIIQFAKAMQSLSETNPKGVELLNMLYILTFCDVKGVSSEAMTDWKASLLEYLYLKTRAVLQKGTFSKEKVSELLPKILEEVLGSLNGEEDQRKAREYLSMMSPRYLLASSSAQILRHVRLWEKFQEDPIVFEAPVLEKEGLNEVTLLTWENAALFSRMAGLFAAHNINILEAQLNLSNKGHALQIFKVCDSEGKAISDKEKWDRVEKDLREVLEGRVKIQNLVDEKFKPSFFKKKVARVLPSKVEIDNDLSAYYTVIDIYAPDRVGLLYQITSTLQSLGLYVDVSKISTKVDQIADIFYVKDIFNHKITSKDRLKKVQETLMKVLDEEPTPGWRPPALV